MNTEQLFAVSALAYRLNNGFFKESATLSDGTVRPSNKQLVSTHLHTTVLPADLTLAQAVMKYCQGLTFRMLSGHLSDFEHSLAKLVSTDTLEVGDNSTGRFNRGVAAAAVSAYYRDQQRIERDKRMNNTLREYLAPVGTRVNTTVEVLNVVYSTNYNCYFVSGITDTNHGVMFSLSTNPEVSTHLQIRGTVKSHRDNFLTQLNRVAVQTAQPK